MKIIVTQDDVDCGVREDCDECAITRATQRASGSQKVQVVNAFDISINGLAYAIFHTDSAKSKQYAEQVGSFIRKFDKGEKVEPFEFEIGRKYDDETEAEE